MMLFYTLGHFFLSLWLWSFTFGLYHAPLSAFFMFILLKLRMRMSIMQALLVSLGLNIFSFVFFVLLVGAILMLALGFEFVPDQQNMEMVLADGIASSSLAVVYIAIQAGLLALLHRFYKLNMSWLSIISIISNILAAWISYAMVPLYH